MKKLLVVMMAVMAITGLMAGAAFAADKLIVKDSVGTTTVFVVQDTGQVGVKTAAPQSSLHVADTVATPARGLISAQHSSDVTGALFIGRKSRGTEASPVAVTTG
ncbi:MAG: hypothetical protein LUO89_07350, partial [Methanothrix sp.]|nr:hypothetical protein [Methanothrix sp.]